MRVVVSNTKEGFRIVEASEVRLFEGSVLVVTKFGESFKAGRHVSWDNDKIEHFLELISTRNNGPMNLSPLSGDYKTWFETPF
jgi:hypothetical protein